MWGAPEEDVQPDSPKPPEPTQSRSSLAGLIVVGALLGFGALLFLANFSGQVSDPTRPRMGGDPFATDKSKNKAKIAKGKGPKVKAGKVPEGELVVIGPPIEPVTPPPGAKNLVVVILTAVRRDHVTPYGGDPKLTPFLNTLASQGARFGDFVSAAPFSRTADVALLTGHHAAALDMVDPGPGPESKVLGEGVTTLAEHLRGKGWWTTGVTSNFNLNSSTGLAQGFDKYRDAQQNGFAPGSRLDGSGVVQNASTFLRDRTDEEKKRPFYLQVSFVDPHQPIRSGPDLIEAWDPDKPNAGYRASVNRVDGYLKLLVDELDALGHTVGKDTYLVVVGDHGEGLEQPPHHGKQHGRLLYESSVAQPWIVAGPEVPGNRVVQGLASSTDLTPTVLELLGLPAPTGVEGRSWAAQVRGQGDRTTRDRAYSDTWYFTANRSSIWTDRLQCQKDFGSIDIDDAFAEGCYDRKTDPDFTNLVRDEALLAELVAWRLEVSKKVTESAALPPPDGEEVPEGGAGGEGAG